MEIMKQKYRMSLHHDLLVALAFGFNTESNYKLTRIYRELTSKEIKHAVIRWVHDNSRFRFDEKVNAFRTIRKSPSQKNYEISAAEAKPFWEYIFKKKSADPPQHQNHATSLFTPGDKVVNVKMPEWGTGTVISQDGSYLFVKFDDVTHTFNEKEHPLQKITSIQNPDLIPQKFSAPHSLLNPFSSGLLRDWFFQIVCDNIINSTGKLTIVGSGPFEQDDFVNFLKNKKCVICPKSAKAEVLIVGTDGWQERLGSVLEEHKGLRLKIFSQEMFLCLLFNKDPYGDREILKEFNDHHPALQYINEWGFEWPTTDIVPSSSTGDLLIGPWPQVGLLKYMGYQVGENGVSSKKRRNILEKIYTSQIPNLFHHDYMKEWGEPLSVTRMKKLSNTIASLARNNKRKQHPPLQAIREWEDDLDWLKKSFYIQTFYFKWPLT